MRLKNYLIFLSLQTYRLYEDRYSQNIYSQGPHYYSKNKPLSHHFLSPAGTVCL
jgi:hypothetical protein